MLVFFVVSLRFEDVALVRIGNENGERNSVDELFPNVVYLNGTSGMVSKIEDVNWVVVVSRETGFAPFYLLNLLQSIQARQVVVGRFGCLPTAAVPEDVAFKRCHRYPIAESGFAMSADLLTHVKDVSPRFEYSVGLSLVGIDVAWIDHFAFRFLKPHHRESGFLASYFPWSASDLPPETAHASGITVDVMLTPHGEASVPLGSNFTFLGNDIHSSDVIRVQCDDDIVRPPRIYSRQPVFRVPCFSGCASS